MLNFMEPILDALNDGSVIRRGVKALVQLTAVLMFLGTLLGIIGLLKASLQAESSLATVGGLLMCVFLIASSVCGIQVFFYRARSIDELGASQFTVVPIAAILIRLFGEFWAITMTAIAIGGCIAAWLGGPITGILGQVPGVSGIDLMKGSFLIGVGILVYCLGMAAVTLVGAYFVAELLVVAVDMARSLRTLVSAAGRGTSQSPPAVRPAAVTSRPISAAAQPAPRPSAPPSAASSVPPPAARPALPPRCPSCGQPVEAGGAFCGDCGAHI